MKSVTIEELAAVLQREKAMTGFQRTRLLRRAFKVELKTACEADEAAQNRNTR